VTETTTINKRMANKTLLLRVTNLLNTRVRKQIKSTRMPSSNDRLVTQQYLLGAVKN